jgi:hypothetical protein
MLRVSHAQSCKVIVGESLLVAGNVELDQDVAAAVMSRA